MIHILKMTTNPAKAKQCKILSNSIRPSRVISGFKMLHLDIFRPMLEDFKNC